MNFTPPASVRRVGDPRWQRFLIRDGGGKYWTGSGFSNNPAEAVLYLRESDAMRAGLNIHEEGTANFTTTVTVSVGRGEWSLKDMTKYLKEWGRFLLMRSKETRTVKVEIQWNELEEDD